MTEKPARAATYARFYETPPQETGHGLRTWITRAANFVIALSEVEAGAKLVREDNADEYMVILAPGCSATIMAGEETIDAVADSLTIVPPGPSTVTALSRGLIARIITTQATDLVAKAANRDTYADGAPEVAPIVAWPDPVGGFRLRHYPLAKYADPDGERIQPRLFRSTNMMVNLFVYYKTRRETDKLSPHWHEDFEQVSLKLAGNWVHHLRWPWTANLAEWHGDEHPEFNTPSAIVIPANVIHTSRDVGDGISSLYDIFAPPRLDFSMKPGFVLNEDEYPMPETSGARIVTKGTLLSWQKAPA